MFSLAIGCDRAAGPGGGPSTAGSKRLVILINGDSPFWTAARQGMIEGAKKYELEKAGLTAFMEVNDGSPDGQIGKLRQFGSQSDIVGVAISPVDANNEAIAEELRIAQGQRRAGHLHRRRSFSRALP